jgi:hypothetical protein
LQEKSLSNELRSESEHGGAAGKFQIVCPECGTTTQAESLNQFPKNFSLLNMIKSSLTSRTGPIEKDQEMSVRDINSTQPEGLRHGTDDNQHYQSVSDYNSTVNYDHHRADFLENLDVHEQVSRSQGGQGDQAGAGEYKRADLEKLDPSEQSAARSSHNNHDFESESLSA